MKNKKLIFIAGFIIGSLLFGFASRSIAEIIYNYNNPIKETYKYNSSNNWEEWRDKNDKPW
jgi:hypothetical protein